MALSYLFTNGSLSFQKTKRSAARRRFRTCPGTRAWRRTRTAPTTSRQQTTTTLTALLRVHCARKASLTRRLWKIMLCLYIVSTEKGWPASWCWCKAHIGWTAIKTLKRMMKAQVLLSNLYFVLWKDDLSKEKLFFLFSTCYLNNRYIFSENSYSLDTKIILWGFQA